MVVVAAAAVVDVVAVGMFLLFDTRHKFHKTD